MDEQPATYEIRLQATPPGWLRDRFDTLRTSPAPTQTALFRRVESSHELDVLLSRLASLGLRLAEVHEHQLSPTSDDDGPHTPCHYEVRVDGRVGETFLKFLRWRHCVVPEQTSVLVEAGPQDVLELLATCSELGLGIERVRLVSRPAEGGGPR